MQRVGAGVGAGAAFLVTVFLGAGLAKSGLATWAGLVDSSSMAPSKSACQPYDAENGTDGITTLIRHSFPPLLGFVPPLTKEELADSC